eukprot:19945-Pelagococcus_subviridis.AAC.3
MKGVEGGRSAFTTRTGSYGDQCGWTHGRRTALGGIVDLHEHELRVVADVLKHVEARVVLLLDARTRVRDRRRRERGLGAGDARDVHRRDAHLIHRSAGRGGGGGGG